VLISSGYGTGCALLAPAGGQVKEVWKNKKFDVKYGPTPILLDGYLYGTNERALVCLDAKTGAVKWEQAGVKGSQMTVADGMFILFSEDGVLRLARLSPEKCEIVSEVKILPGQQRWASPILANGKLYVRDDAKLLCLDVTGK
jgi:outer membrane protein assembly factor BamB